MAIMRPEAFSAVPIFNVAAVLFFILVLVQFGSVFPVFPQTSVSTGEHLSTEGDLIHYGDLIDVDVVGNLDGDWRGTVNPEGFIQGLQYAADPIYALCKSEE